MRFSELSSEFHQPTNALYARLEELRREQVSWVDMVRGSPADIGVSFPGDLLDGILADASLRARAYHPDPLGQREARDGIEAYYGHHRVRAEHILITPGTSIAYWYLFKLLCDPGDNVLCPVPSYPLFDYIARLAGIEISNYRLDEGSSWRIDLGHLESQVNPRSRAIVLISPHNPTGMVAGPDQIEGIAEIAQRHGLPIVADEVFWSFIADGVVGTRSLETDAPLVFTLNGFSKMYALAGMKLGWIAVSGEPQRVRTAMSTLELISDTFLPVNEIAQFAAPDILRMGRSFLSDYRVRVQSSCTRAAKLLANIVPTPPAGGFYVVIPCDSDEEQVAIELLGEDHVLVHPGYFYDIEGSHLVLSFLKDVETLNAVLPKIARKVSA